MKTVYLYLWDQMNGGQLQKRSAEVIYINNQIRFKVRFHNGIVNFSIDEVCFDPKQRLHKAIRQEQQEIRKAKYDWEKERAIFRLERAQKLMENVQSFDDLTESVLS